MNTTQPVTETFGNITVITWTDTEGISINIFTAGQRNSTLSDTFVHTRRDAAKIWYRTIRDAALTGTPTWQIEAQMSALIDAGQATEPPATLDAYTVPGQRDFSAGRTHRKPPTPAELDVIRRAVRNDDGTFTVRTRPGQSWTVLKALNARIPGKVTIRPGTARVIDALTYTAEQLAPYMTSEEIAA